MIIKTIVCDVCGNTCKGDWFVVYRRNEFGVDVGKRDICNTCYSLMLSALEVDHDCV